VQVPEIAAPDVSAAVELYSSPSKVTPVGLVTGLPPRDIKPGKQSSTLTHSLTGTDALRFDAVLNATRVGGMPEKLFATLPAKPHAVCLACLLDSSSSRLLVKSFSICRCSWRVVSTNRFSSAHS
jgi:hypothetical protein